MINISVSIMDKIVKLVLVILLLNFLSCSKGDSTTPNSAVSKGDRVLGLHISEPQNGFISAFTTSQRLTYDAVNLHFFWGVGNFSGTLPGIPLETNVSADCIEPSAYDMSLIIAANGFYPNYGKKFP